MMQRRIVIAGTGSGVGKTTVTIGLMAALRKRGLQVQGFKCGPDYIDPTYHTAVTGRSSRNLDSWMFSEDTLKEIYARGAQGADVSVIEGVMGFYDGRDPLSDAGSTAEISAILDSPVLLVINVQSMARSAAAIVQGFQSFNPRVRIAAVVANNAGSENHYRLVQAAVEETCGIPVIGWLKRDEALRIPERHLGLVPSIERGELGPLFDGLADRIAETFDLDRLLSLAEAPAITAEAKLFARKSAAPKVTVAVAKDAAFHFYYPENLELLEAYGAELVYFSPLAGEPVPPHANGLYIGGGFPEQFAAELAAGKEVKASVRGAIEAGMPTIAECGGFMYLTGEIEDTEGCCFPMAGVLPGRVKMQRKLAALGYRELAGMAGNPLLGSAEYAKGHEFHYSVYEPADVTLAPAYLSKGLRGTKEEGMLYRNAIAGYTHVHFASNPEMVGRFLNQCLDMKEGKR